MLLGNEMNHIKFSRFYPWIICDMGSKINWMLNYRKIRKRAWYSLVMKTDPLVHEHRSDGCIWIMCVVCFFSCAILNPSPNILLDSWKPFSVHLHYFKTSAALGFKLCIRVLRICREISKQVSCLNNSVGNAVEACSSMRVLITALKCLKPNSFTIAVSCYFLRNYIFAIYISLWDTMVQLSQGTQCRQFRSPNCKLRCFLSNCGPPTVVAEIVWSSMKPPCPTPSHIPSH